jgi:hypothetical protein
MSQSAERFFLLLPPAMSPEDELTRAFLWLKRSIEKTATSGVLTVPDVGYLRTTLASALGAQLTDLLEEEGRLSLGEGVVMHCQEAARFEPPARAPLVLVQPDASRLEALDDWPGAILVVGEPTRALMSWIGATEAEAL